MSSDLKQKTIQCLEWCTDLPSKDNCFCSSLFFSLKCTDWRFLLRYTYDFYNVHFTLYLQREINRNSFGSCHVKFEVGFKNEEKLNLHKGEFTLLETYKAWSISERELRPSLPPDFNMGNRMKFRFYFHDVVANPLINSRDDKSIQTPSYIDARFIQENITEDFSKLLEEGQNYDVEFICEDQTFKAHKIILSNRSDVFASMLHSDMIEGKTGRVNIQDMDAAAFKQFLKFLYTGILPDLTVDTAIRFYEAGDKYNVSTLKKHCADYLADNLSPENMCEILIIADRHNDSDFKKIVVQYIKGHKTP